jgi:hypothetical protein
MRSGGGGASSPRADDVPRRWQRTLNPFARRALVVAVAAHPRFVLATRRGPSSGDGGHRRCGDPPHTDIALLASWELVFLAAAVVGVILGAHPRQAATRAERRSSLPSGGRILRSGGRRPAWGRTRGADDLPTSPPSGYGGPDPTMVLPTRRWPSLTPPAASDPRPHHRGR